MQQQNQIPDWLKGYLKAEDFGAVEAALVQAEAGTSAEVVPMVVRSSTPVGHVPYLVFLTLLLLQAGVLLAVGPTLPESALLVGEAASLLLTAVISVMLSRLPFIQRLGIKVFASDDLPWQRAKVEFYEKDIQRTKGRNGILLFVSLLERRAIVLADKAVADRLQPQIWQDLVQQLVKAGKERNLGTGLVEAVHSCGVILSRYFPLQSGDENELPNHLLIKE